MAEFTEVFRHAQRMCNDNSCDACPLNYGNQNYTHCGIRPFEGAHVDEIEKIVMDWAKKHPEPYLRYPTWQEWLEEQHINSPARWYYEPIPDDIAEKLGLTKREIRNGQN